MTQHKRIQAESARSFPWELDIRQDSKITRREAEKTLHRGGSGYGMQLLPQTVSALFPLPFLRHPRAACGVTAIKRGRKKLTLRTSVPDNT